MQRSELIGMPTAKAKGGWDFLEGSKKQHTRVKSTFTSHSGISIEDGLLEGHLANLSLEVPDSKKTLQPGIVTRGIWVIHPNNVCQGQIFRCSLGSLEGGAFQLNEW